MAYPSSETTIQSVIRIQNFDTSTLVRREELGSKFSFEEALPHANRLKNIFLQIPTDFLNDVAEPILSQIENQANSTYSDFEAILNFNPQIDSPVSTRESLISRLRDNYSQTFLNLYNIIGYLTSRQKDYSALEREAKASLQSVSDEVTKIKDQLNEDHLEAQRILGEVKRVAAEQGVSQQAKYFKDEAESHAIEASKWREYTIRTALGLGFFAAGSIFFHKIPFLVPSSTYDVIQLAISKVLVFGVIAYMLALCAKNFLSHKHNQIINRHRQNALLTFNALVDAAGSEDRRDIVLTHASACIFSPQDTGYTKTGGGNEPTQTKFIEILPKLTVANSGS